MGGPLQLCNWNEPLFAGQLPDSLHQDSRRAGGLRTSADPDHGTTMLFASSNRVTRSADALVFVVDDDVSARTAAERLLRPTGFRVQLFASTLDFLQAA